MDRRKRLSGETTKDIMFLYENGEMLDFKSRWFLVFFGNFLKVYNFYMTYGRAGNPGLHQIQI